MLGLKIVTEPRSVGAEYHHRTKASWVQEHSQDDKPNEGNYNTKVLGMKVSQNHFLLSLTAMQNQGLLGLTAIPEPKSVGAGYHQRTRTSLD